MSTTDADPARDRQPGAADAAALAQAAAEAAAPAESADAASSAVARAAEQTANERGFHLSDEDIRRFTQAFIGELERRGAWDSTPAHQATPPSEPAAEQAAEHAAQQTVTPPAASAPDGEVETPRKKSFAERFMGEQ